MKYTWSEIRKWMTARFLNFSIYLTLPTISALIILSTLKSKAQLMKECENDIVDYYYRIYHYFKAIKDYKRTLYKKRKEEDFNQQNLNFFIIITSFREDIITTITI